MNYFPCDTYSMLESILKYTKLHEKDIQLITGNAGTSKWENSKALKLANY